MTTTSDLKTKMQALIDYANATKSVADSALKVLTAQQASITDLKTQLANAIASGNPDDLQTLSDNMDSTLSIMDASKNELATAIANVPTDTQSNG